MYAVGLNEAPRLPARVRVNGAPADAALWLDAVRAARPLPSPASAPTVTEGAAGDLTGAYRWLVAFGSAVMVSYPSPVSALLTVTGKRVDLSAVPTSTDGRVTKRRIYRTVAGGSVYKLVGEIADNVTTDFEDNVADGALTDEYLAVTVFADGNAMDEGADRSRYGNHATQGTAALRPLFKVGILNGRPGVLFDGSNDRLDIAALTLGQPRTIFWVLKTLTLDSSTRIFWDGQAAAGNWLGHTSANERAMDAGGTLSGSAGTTNAEIWVAIFNGASSRIDVNGATVLSGATGNNAMTAGRLGYSNADGHFWNGYLFEGVGYNALLSDATIRRLVQYASRKYAIAVS